MDIAAFVVLVVSAIGTVLGILYARRSASADRIGAIAARAATEASQKQLAIEEDRRRDELEQRGDPALEGRVVRSPDDDGTGRDRLEIHVANGVKLISMTVILSAGSPLSAVARTVNLVEDWRQFPESGTTLVRAGHPAWWRVHVVGDPEPFTVHVMACGDRGARWERLPVRVTFDDWAPPPRSLPRLVRWPIREHSRW